MYDNPVSKSSSLNSCYRFVFFLSLFHGICKLYLTTTLLIEALVLVLILVLVQTLVAVAVTVVIIGSSSRRRTSSSRRNGSLVVVLDDCGDTYEGLWLDLAGFPFRASSADLPQSFRELPVPTHNFCLQRQRFSTARGDGTAIVVMLLAALGVGAGA